MFKLVSRATALIVALSVIAASQARGVQEGERLEPFRGKNVLTGKTLDLKDLRGKVVVIDFWATWCGPCRMVLPHIKEMYEKYHEQGVEVVGISLDQNLGKLKAFVAENKMKWPQICDGGGWGSKYARQYGVRGIPQVVVLDKDGVVISPNAHGERLENAIKTGLARKWKGGEKLQRRAERLLERATHAIEAGDKATALSTYEEIIEQCAGVPAAAEAKARLAKLKQDPEALAQAAVAEENEECVRFLRFARQMARANQEKMAIKYYRKVLDTCPETELATEAQTELAKLES